MELHSTDHLAMTADITAAYVANNNVIAADLPALIRSVHSALHAINEPAVAVAPKLEPAVAIKKSITPDFLISLEDGRKYKSLKRHLSTKYNMTPDAYRAKWGLPKEYPMVAPNYAASRSELAKKMGLGSRGRQAPAARVKPAAVSAKPAAKPRAKTASKAKA